MSYTTCSIHNIPLKNRKDSKGKYCVLCQRKVTAMKKGRGKK